MGFLGNMWDGITGAPGQGWDLLKGAGEGAGKAYDWLGERPGGPTSNVPNPTRSNFDTPGGQARADQLNALAGSFGQRQAPQSADSAQFRGYQNDLASRLMGQVNGQDSMANLALRQSTDQNIAQQRSMAAGAAPGNSAMAQRMAMQNIGNINQGFGSQAAMLGIQERNAAANSLAGLSGQARGQDLQNNQFNAGAQMQQTGMNDQAAAQARQQELANAQLRQQGNLAYEQNNTQRYGIDKAVPQQPSNFDRIIGAAGAVAPFLLAEGGVVTKPTEAIVGEAGPELVMPIGSLLKDPEEEAREKRRSFAFEQSQHSEDPLVRGLGAIANAYRASQKKGKEQAGIQSRLAGQVNGPTLQARQLANTASGDPGYRLMAEGGVVDQPTRAIIGEAGPEAVIPLRKLPDLIARLKGTDAPPPHGDVSQTYGPPQPAATLNAWRPSNEGEMLRFRDGVDWRAEREAGRSTDQMFQGGAPKMSQSQWLAFLHGLGVQ